MDAQPRCGELQPMVALSAPAGTSRLVDVLQGRLGGAIALQAHGNAIIGALDLTQLGRTQGLPSSISDTGVGLFPVEQQQRPVVSAKGGAISMSRITSGTTSQKMARTGLLVDWSAAAASVGRRADSVQEHAERLRVALTEAQALELPRRRSSRCAANQSVEASASWA